VLTLGLIINPLAGIGGSVGLKGSDGSDIVKEAFSRGAHCKSSERAKLSLDVLVAIKDQIKIITCPQTMGEDLVAAMGFNYQVLDNIAVKQRSSYSIKMSILFYSQGVMAPRGIFAVS
jgi:predicted polyphosphate/ATP-dependent NAD kinase